MPPRHGPRLYEHPDDAVVVPPRAFDCWAYEHCLLRAARNKWRSWTCKGCPKCPDDARLEVWKSSRPPDRAVLRGGVKG